MRPLILSVWLAAAGGVLAQPDAGVLDPSFSNGGVHSGSAVFTPFDQVQVNDAGDWFAARSGSHDDQRVTLMAHDGAREVPDLGTRFFAPMGTATDGDAFFLSLLILVGSTADNRWEPALARFTPAGIDSAFADGGIRRLSGVPDSLRLGAALTYLDGRLYAEVRSRSGATCGVLALDAASGDLVPTFGDGGLLVLPDSAPCESASITTASGALVHLARPAEGDAVIATRIDLAGMASAPVTVPIGGAGDVLSSRVVPARSGGYFVVTVERYRTTSVVVAVRKARPDGSADPDFQGSRTEPRGYRLVPTVQLAEARDGRWMVVYSYRRDLTSLVEASQYLADGTIDPDFGFRQTLASLTAQPQDYRMVTYLPKVLRYGPDGGAFLALYSQPDHEGYELPLVLKTRGTVSTAGDTPPDTPGALSVGPNPSSHRATLRFALAAPAAVSVRLVDALGRTVREVTAQPLAEGPQSLSLDVSGLPAGLYVAVLDDGRSVRTARLTVAR